MIYGYANKWLDVDLTNQTYEIISFDEKTIRDFMGGAGMGAKILYDRVQPGTKWDDPENCIIICGGPLNASKIAGSGTHCEITLGPLTNGATSTQAMGFFGAYLPSAGFDGIIVHGKSEKLTYLCIADGKLEFGDAVGFAGMSTLDTELAVKEKIGAPSRKSSVFCVGPAGENLVRFACAAGDNGHVAAHNGVGAVWGSKKLKAIAVKRGDYQVELFNAEEVKRMNKEMVEAFRVHPIYTNEFHNGTSALMGKYFDIGLLPYKNLTSNVIPDEYHKLEGDYYRTHFESKREPCYGCPSFHCNIITVTEGDYKGFTGDEPEYELMAGMGTIIGNSDPGAAIMLANQWDLIGCDGNEGSWLTGFAIECYERGLLSKKDTDGLELTWGNVEAVKQLIWKIGRNEPGIGRLLAQGVKRAAESIGGEALNIGVYQMRGHAPRGHDHRARWTELFDAAVSNIGTVESTHVKLAPDLANDPEAIANTLYKGKMRCFVDSLCLCMFPTMTMISTEYGHLVDLINAATGWDTDLEECFNQAQRTVNLFRVINLLHGIKADEVEYPSKRYGSAPLDGPQKGKCVMDVWDETLDAYYKLMNWDRKTGWPKKERLCELGLDFAVRHIPV